MFTILELNILSDTYYDNKAAKEVVEILKKIEDDLGDSVLYYQYPIFREIDDDLYYPTFMLVSPKYGVNLFLVDSIGIERDKEIESLTDRIFKIEQIIFSKLIKSLDKKLIEKRRKLKFNLGSVLCLPYFSNTSMKIEIDVLTNKSDFESYFNNIEEFSLDKSDMNEIFSILESSTGIIKPKERNIDTYDNKELKASVLKILEEEISIFDKEQKFAALSQLNGPQRIRGLAGSGKTIILCMKAALLHLKYPEKKILYTFMTKSLYDYIEVLITRFYKLLGDGYLPDFKNNIHVRHSWGGQSLTGVYYEACRNNNAPIVTFTEAKKNSPNGNTFDYVCKELLDFTNGKLMKEYDYILIDEGQDFPSSFYQVCRELVKNDCLVWAYDDLQNIYDVKIQNPVATFKNEYGAEGINLSEIQNRFPDMNNDIVLHKCYRNPKEILVTAHALGFGIYNEILIQTLENEQHWEDVGYKVISGRIIPGEQVEIERPDENSPLSINKYSNSEDFIKCYSAEDLEDEISWIVSEIKIAIEVDGLRPDDIAVISLDDYYNKTYFRKIASELAGQGIYTNNLSSNFYLKGFSEEGKVTLSTVHKAKGHEAAMAFVIGCDVFENSKNNIKMRNKIFTAFTRTKAWLRISGINISNKSLINEIEEVKRNNYKLNFIHKERHIIKRDLKANVKKEVARDEVSEMRKKLKGIGYTDKEIKDVVDEQFIDDYMESDLNE